MTLSTKEMDEINYLLTEVSLELLGNKFYDINGQCRDSLFELYSADFLKNKSPTYAANKSDLVKELGIEHLIENDFIKVAPEKQLFNKPASKPPIVAKKVNERRQSADNGNLLIPMKSKKSIPIQRRKTIFESNPKSYYTSPVKHKKYVQPFDKFAIPKPLPERIRKSTQLKDDPTTLRKLLTPSSEIKETLESSIKANANNKPENYKIQLIKEKINFEFARMNRISQKQREAGFLKNQYRMETEYLDEYEIVDEYHKTEQNMLTKESSMLIEFVKFVRSDPQHEDVMQEVATNILAVKDQII